MFEPTVLSEQPLSSLTSSAPGTAFCPSCGAQSSTEERAVAGNENACPVCGTAVNGADSPIADTTLAAPAASEDLLPPAVQKRVKTSAEAILLERLLNEPAPESAAQPRKNIAGMMVGLIVLILAVSMTIYYSTKKEEKYSAIPLQSPNTDDSEIVAKRALAAPILDSLVRALQSNPNDSTHLALANGYYDAEYWDKARAEYEIYLAKHPENADARVDYGFTLMEATKDPKVAIAQFDKALESQPNHLNALFNAGILSLRVEQGGHAEAALKAKDYFERAREVAKTKNPDLIPQIDTILAAVDRIKAKS